jgi:single-strand DNA-binding protein
MSMNLIVVSGRVTGDPEAKEFNGKKATCFSVAADTRERTSDGNYIPIFYRITAWGSLGDRCLKYLRKGERIIVTGDLTQRCYLDNSGKPKVSNSISARDVDFLSGRRDQGSTNKRQDDDLPFE